MLNKNEIYDIEINDLTVDGLGIGRIDGMAVFVADMLPGEQGQVKIIKTAKNYAVGRRESVTTVSPERVAPPCPVFKQCGGCTLQHMDYFAQLRAKHAHVQDCIRKFAKIDAPVNFPLPAKQPFGYRNKTSFPVSKGKDGAEIGCYRAKTHLVINTERCLLQPVQADQCIEIIRQWMNTYGVSAYDEATGQGLVRHAVVRSTVYGDIMVGLVINGNEIPHEKELIRGLRVNLPEVMSVVLNSNREKGNVILGQETRAIFGSDRIRENINGLDFDISLNTFLQVNHDQTELLYNQVFKLARIFPDEVVADLYCGAGTITLHAAKLAKKVFGIEIIPQAIEDANNNAKINGIENAVFICGDCAEAFEKILQKEGKLDVVIVDPPRKGLDAKVINEIVLSGAKRVIYVSCDPATLARDLALFAENDYAAQVVQPVDLFPQTTHVETCVLLSHKNPQTSPPSL